MELFTTKLGKTRAGERTRIWIEGERLKSHGFTVGDHFERRWNDDRHGGGIDLIKCTFKEYSALPRDQRGTVSGKEDKPIIDIAGARVAATFRGTHVAVTYTKGRILIRNSNK